jgi:hypothetical protein
VLDELTGPRGLASWWSFSERSKGEIGARKSVGVWPIDSSESAQESQPLIKLSH